MNDQPEPLKGVLLVDKPADWTSFDVVNYTRRIVANHEGKKPKNTKVGHTGTLDPFATGLLVLLIGKDYTRKAGELTKVDKTYEVTMRFGESSTTGDPEGEINKTEDAKAPTEDELKEVIKQFEGEIEQVPPAFSAIKIDGQRAYKLAREGKEVKIEPRKVVINKLDLVQFNYPEAKLVADVSSGTYIRTLVEDIAKALDTTAYTTELRRTKVGKFNLESAVMQANLSPETIIKNLQTL